MKKDSSTSRILTLIRNADTFEEASEYHRQNPDPTLSDALYALMDKKKLSAKELIQACRIERSYFYHILSGQKHPGRNMVLRIAFCLRANLDETNQLLRLAGFSGLYAKIKRDAIIIFAIAHKMNMDEVNDLLATEKQEPLFMEEKDG